MQCQTYKKKDTSWKNIPPGRFDPYDSWFLKVCCSVFMQLTTKLKPCWWYFKDLLSYKLSDDLENLFIKYLFYQIVCLRAWMLERGGQSFKVVQYQERVFQTLQIDRTRKLTSWKDCIFSERCVSLYLDVCMSLDILLIQAETFWLFQLKRKTL